MAEHGALDCALQCIRYRNGRSARRTRHYCSLHISHDYAISNDEGVQHHYGELIIAYYRSGFADQSVFHFENLYLYGGLFDIIAVALSHLLPMDPYDLRHIMCALIGLGGIGAPPRLHG